MLKFHRFHFFVPCDTVYAGQAEEQGKLNAEIGKQKFENRGRRSEVRTEILKATGKLKSGKQKLESSSRRAEDGGRGEKIPPGIHQHRAGHTRPRTHTYEHGQRP